MGYLYISCVCQFDDDAQGGDERNNRFLEADEIRATPETLRRLIVFEGTVEFDH